MRYRLLAVAFGLVVSLAPLALLAAALRRSEVGGLVAGSLVRGSLSFAWPIAVAAATVAALLLTALALDVARVLQVKRRAVRVGAVPVRSAALGESAAVLSPTAIGYLHPAVIVPAEFRSRVDGGEWAAVLAHESAHLARRDDWAKAVQSTFLRVGWWLPGLWVLAGALDLERELASDERAAEATGARRYAACLLRLATDRCGDVAPAFWGRRRHVAIRVERLLRPLPGVGRLARAAALGAFTATALAVVIAALIAVPAIVPVPAPSPPHRPTASRLAIHPLAPRSSARRAPHMTAHARQPVLPATVPRPLALLSIAPVPPRTAIRPRRPHRRSVAPAVSRPLAVRSASAVVAYTARRRCPTCFGPEHLAEDAFGAGPDAGVPRSEPGQGGGAAAGTLLWIRLPAPGANP